jgi:putative peptidoglycan lipid II flippase
VSGDRNASGGLVRATGVMAVGTLLSRLTGVMRLWAFSLLGISILTDTYLFANNTPNMVYELVVGGVLSSTLVPLFVGLLTPRPRPGRAAPRADGSADGDGEDTAARSIDAVVTLSIAAVVALAVVLWIAAPWIISLLIDPSRPAAQRELATTLLRMFAPQVVGYGLVSLGTALLNARRRFGAPMFAPILNNVLVTVVFLVAARMIDGLQRTAGALGTPGALGTAGGTDADALDLLRFELVAGTRRVQWLLGLGTTAGVLAMAAVVVVALRRDGVRLRPRWAPRDPAVSELLALSGWTIGYVVANQVALFFVSRVASRADGAMSAYNLANTTFFLLPHGVLAVSVITAMQPDLARAFVERRVRDFRRMTETGVRTLLAVIVPSAVGLFVLARPLTSIVLGHGNSGAADTAQVAAALRAFVIGLPAFSVYLFLMSALKALRDTRATWEVNAVENAINIVLAGLLFPLIGVRGLALSYALAYLVAAVVALGTVGRRIGGVGGGRLLAGAGDVIAAAAVMGVVVAVAAGAVDRVLGGPSPLLGRTLGDIVEVGVSAAAGVTVYVLVGRRLGVREITAALSMIRRRLGR